MTADGNNNTGKLTIPFGAEGMDTISGGDVFNGKMNVYWQLVYGLYPARRLMWQNREAAGTWNADAYLEFATGWQNYLPERVYNRDFWYKYLRPYEQNNDTTYISMLEGGKKTHQREAFVRNNLTYMASQYTGTYCTSDSITVRAYTPGVSDDMTDEEAAIINATISAVPPNPVVQVMLYNKGYIVVEVASVMKRIKAEKGVYYTVDFSESSSSMNDTVVNIHGASNVRAIGDMSSLYIKFCNFSKATKLRSLQIGSNVSGYTNLGLESVGFESNPMLEELYIQNCPNSTSTLDLSGCQSLKKIDVRGSGFTGIIFATGGLVDKADLCSPASLTLMNLYNLTDSNLTLESYNNLTTLRFEDCPEINSLTMVNNAVNLNRVRILGVDWGLSDSTLLNQMLLKQGLDENNHNTNIAVLTGSVYISGQIRNQELLNYENAWENLQVTYNPLNLVEQYLATYVNADGTVLYAIYVDRGSAPPDIEANGTIPTPALSPTEQYTFTYNGWDDITSVMLAPRTITAQYTETVRSYKVTWYSRTGLSLGSVTANYGDDVEYSGETPTNVSEEGTYIYNLFKGWDKSTGYIRGDTDVYAIWDRVPLPSTDKDLKDMSEGEIFAVTSAQQTSNYFVDKDYHDITLGHDFNFTNVQSEIIAQDVYLDGTTPIRTNISLFGENSPSFTLAVDFRFTNTSDVNNTLIGCYDDDGNEGFRLRYNNYPNIQWGDRNVNVGYSGYRDMVVLRHRAGDDKLYVYSSNGNSSTFAHSISRNELVRTRSTSTDQKLILGGVYFEGDGGYDDCGSGYIYWSKIWYDDLGDTNARALASWSHEVVRVEYCGTGRYRLAGNTSQRCNASFIANTCLVDRLHNMNPTNVNAGGWDASNMRAFMNARLPSALPTAWRTMLKQVKITATEGNQSTSLTVSEDWFYLPCLTEMGGLTSEPYASEGSKIAWFTGDIYRAKFRGMIIPETARYFVAASDPSTSSTNTDYKTGQSVSDIRSGDVWRDTSNSNICYIYATNEEVRYYGLAKSIAASIGGYWVSAYGWWERSPGVGNSTGFWNVNNGGNTGGSTSASYAGGVCPYFSI